MHQHLTGRMLLSHTFVHGIVWQYIYIISVHTGCFRHFQLLQVTRQSSLGQSESFFRQFLQQLFLATYFLTRIIILMASSLLFLLFILHNYSDSAAKLQNIREYRYKKENIFATLCIFSIKLLSIIPRVNQNHTKFFFSMRSS